MRIALAPLAFGTLTTWLLAGPFCHLLAESLPFHDLRRRDDPRDGAGGADRAGHLDRDAGRRCWGWLPGSCAKAWSGWRKQLGGLGAGLPAQVSVSNGSTAWIVAHTRSAAEDLSVLQTGLLNWNLVGIVVGLIAVLVWLAWTVTLVTNG